MYIGTLVPGESYVAELTLLLGLEHGLHAPAFAEDAVGIAIADHFVKREQIDVVGLEAPERFFELLRSGLFRLAVDLGHQEWFLPVALEQGFAHGGFALSAVVVPTVGEKFDAAVEPAANDADAFLFVGLHAEVISTEADH